MSRIAPLQPPYAPEVQEQFDRIMRGAAPLVLFRVMAGHPRAWEKFRGGSLLDRGPLSCASAKSSSTAPARSTRCEYEWGVHVATFAAAARTDARSKSAPPCMGAADAACWSAAEQAMIAAVDALHAALDAR